jgi:ferredoxin
MTFHACYFSATGNTERALRAASAELAAAGHAVVEHPLRAGSAAPALSAGDGLIVAFPVLAKAAPVFVARFIRSLVSGAEAEGGRRVAAVLGTDGGDGGYAAERTARLLRARGYEVVAAVLASYPSNWSQALAAESADRVPGLLEAGDRTARAFGASLARLAAPNSAAAPRPRLLDYLFPRPFGLFGRRFFGKAFYADADCDACGLCARACPSATIRLGRRKNARPYWRANCESCNRCINICPRGAIVSSIGRPVVLMAAIVAFAWAGIAAFRLFGYPRLSAFLAPVPLAAADALIIAAIIVASHFAAIGPFDAYLLRPLQRLPGLRRFFAWSYTKGARRYLAPGFRPSARR